MRKKLRVAIVGCGGMGGGHAIAIDSGTGRAIWKATGLEGGQPQAEPNTSDISSMLELAGVYDIDEARNAWARSMGFFVYDSFEAQLADPSVDVILVATPNHLHRSQSIRAMQAGKHVLCEKPVTVTSAELAEILQVARETGRVFYPRQNRRWDRDYLITKEIFDSKSIGDVFHLESRIMGSRGIPGDWRAVKAYGGGMLLDWGVHLIDRLLMMTLEPVKSVYCRLTYITNKDCDDGFQMVLVFQSGLTAYLEVGTWHFIKPPIWYIAGTNGTAVIENWDCSGRIMRPIGSNAHDAKPIIAGEGLTKTMAPRDVTSVEEASLPDISYDRNTLYANFARTIWGEAEQIVTGEQAMRVMKLIEAANYSSDHGVAVAFE